MKLKPEDAKEVGRLLESMGLVSAKKGAAIAEAVLTWHYKCKVTRLPHTRFLQVGQKIDTMDGWAKSIGVHPTTLRDRLKAGWSVDDACTLPRIKRDSSRSILSHSLGGTSSLVINRLRRGWSEEKAVSTPSRRLSKTSKYRGVYQAAGRWAVYVYGNKKLKWVGAFHSEILAAHAYDRAAYALLGDKAKLNFPLKKRGKK